MKYSTNDIIEFLIELAGTSNIKPDSDIFDEVGMGGDDFHEMIEKYAKQFSVNIENYLWYFHADEEGFGSLGGLFFEPPYKRVKRIPVTPNMLTEFANLAYWNIEYPPHELPKYRYDLKINTFFVGIIALVTIIWVIVKLLD